MRRLVLLAALAVGLSGCLGDNQLAGSVSALFPLDVSAVDVMRNDQALQVSYYENRGADVDLVIRLTVYVADYAPLQTGRHYDLYGEYEPGHQRTTVVHMASGEPVRVFGAVKHGDLVIDQGGNPGDQTRGNFSLAFFQGDDYGAGRSLQGTFARVALDAGFGPETNPPLP